MLHLFLYGLLAILLAGGLFLLASWLLPAGEQIAPPIRDEAPWELPIERPMGAEDVDGVRLPVALRGYRFAETDLLLDRLAAELRARDAEIARLRGDVPDVPAGSAGAPAEAGAPAAVDGQASVDEHGSVDQHGSVDEHPSVDEHAPVDEDAPVE